MYSVLRRARRLPFLLHTATSVSSRLSRTVEGRYLGNSVKAAARPASSPPHPNPPPSSSSSPSLSRSRSRSLPLSLPLSWGGIAPHRHPFYTLRPNGSTVARSCRQSSPEDSAIRTSTLASLTSWRNDVESRAISQPHRPLVIATSSAIEAFSYSEAENSNVKAL